MRIRGRNGTGGEIACGTNSIAGDYKGWRRSALLIAWGLLMAAGPVLAGTVNVSVKDPDGALVAGASVTLDDRTQTTGNQGRVSFGQLAAGSYEVSVTKQGFVPWTNHVTVLEQPLDLTVSLKLKAITTSVRVSARRSPLANSDPNYQALRNGKLIQVHRVANLVLNRRAAGARSCEVG